MPWRGPSFHGEPESLKLDVFVGRSFWRNGRSVGTDGQIVTNHSFIDWSVLEDKATGEEPRDSPYLKGF